MEESDTETQEPQDAFFMCRRALETSLPANIEVYHLHKKLIKMKKKD